MESRTPVRMPEDISLIDTYNSSVPWNKADRIIIETTTATSPALVNHTQKSIRELLYNGTGYYIEDEQEPGLTDIQTLFLACFATLVPLVITLLTAFGIRILWAKYKNRKESAQYDGILHREGTSESIVRPLHSHLLNDKQCGSDHMAINTEEVEICDNSGANTSQIRSNHSSTNGSIITMTLKNNHLIVETEERNDIEEDSRETTMKYSPGARDGVFVVEVQQGVRRSPGSGGPTSSVEPELSVSVSDQCALVHNPPDRYSDEETLEECDYSEYYVETVSPNRETPDSLTVQVRTGLTQSNTSLASNRQSYCYTNQQCYDSGSYGYPTYCGYINDTPVVRPLDDTRPKITAAVYKNPGNSCDSVDLDLSLNGITPTEEDLDDFDDIENQDLQEHDNPGKFKQQILSGPPKFEKLHNDISPRSEVETEADVRSAEYENKCFESNDVPTKS